jgi:hypothetical protein
MKIKQKIATFAGTSNLAGHLVHSCAGGKRAGQLEIAVRLFLGFPFILAIQSNVSLLWLTPVRGQGEPCA